MNNLIKNIFAVVVGVFVGSLVNMAIIQAGPLLIPLPDGVDLSNMDEFANNLKLLKPANFIAPWLAHALGTLVGAYLAAKIAGTHRMLLALCVSGFFLFGGLAMVLMFGGPVWFSALDLLLAYLPMGYAGGILGGGKSGRSE